MIAIPLQISATHYNLYIIMEQDNLDRIRAYDPAVIETSKFPPDWKHLLVNEVVLMFATAEEIKASASTRNVPEMLNNLSRGFKYRPDLGDHDSDSYQKQNEN